MTLAQNSVQQSGRGLSSASTTIAIVQFSSAEYPTLGPVCYIFLVETDRDEVLLVPHLRLT